MVTAVPVRFDPQQVAAFWSGVAAMRDALDGARRHLTGARTGSPAEAGLSAVTRVSGSLTDLVGAVSAAGMPPRDAVPGARVDRGSARWVSAVHEAGHAVATGAVGGRSQFVGVCGPDTGLHRITADTRLSGLVRAVTAVAGERATRVLLGTGGGSDTDYRAATDALSGTGWTVADAEARADALLRVRRRDVERLATGIYRRGRVDRPAPGRRLHPV